MEKGLQNVNLHRILSPVIHAIESEHKNCNDPFEIKHTWVRDNGMTKLKVKVGYNEKWISKKYTLRKVEKMKEDPHFEIEKDIYILKKELKPMFDVYANPVTEDIHRPYDHREAYTAIIGIVNSFDNKCFSYDIWSNVITDYVKGESFVKFKIRSNDNSYNKLERDISWEVIDAIMKARGSLYIRIFTIDILMNAYLKKEDGGFRSQYPKIPEKKEEWDD